MANETLESWDFKAKGFVNRNEVFLLGTRHLPMDIPPINEVFQQFNPTFVLLESPEDESLPPALVELKHAYKLCQQKKLDVGCFDVSIKLAFKKIRTSCSLIDSFILYAHIVFIEELTLKKTPQINCLINAIKANYPNMINAAVDNWLNDLSASFIIMVGKRGKRGTELNKIRSHACFENYKKYLYNTVISFYKTFTKSNNDVIPSNKEELKPYANDQIKRFKELKLMLNPNCAMRIWRNWRSKQFLKRIKSHLIKKRGRVLILTGYLHFEKLKNELKLR